MAELNRRALLLTGVGGALTILTTALWAAPKLLSGSISTTSGQRRTRVLLEANGELKYRYFTLTEPDRLVIDIDGMVQNSALTALAKQKPHADSFISRIRLGQKDKHTVRVVFDLKRPIKAQISRLPSVSGSHKYSLVVDMVESNTSFPTQINTTPNTPTTAASETVTPDARVNPTTPNKPQTVLSQSNTRRPIIMLDPGHGGKDPGAIGASGLKEKDVVLDCAHHARQFLEAKGFEVHMTRNNDTFVALPERRQMARRVQADLFVSIHANAIDKSTPRGTDVFVWGANANSERARKLALAENEGNYADGIPDVGNPNVNVILTDMLRTQTSNDSTRLGNLMLKHFSRYNKLHTPTVDKADFLVLRSLDIPSVLVELAFLSNAEDEKLLANSVFRRNMAQAMANSIEIYLQNTTLIQR
ncbi:MAG: N-acetylmuramoyl-L-alanine amidase [Alysiella sp.]|uniref:N-acetylmuramoyl-L-alanine amidase n=1 Tax=Alysiella sp. TaxID=1872483 RepID=UPI0026DCFA2A|nr:N-acetylmuramoyl-L-alanine amidase [Alysiella sp.]MDO4434513.1 N-acetylmuramoyl-L-alanine amidase [Alysiella sp.]